MDLKEIHLKDVNWMHLDYDKGPMAGSCEHGNEPSGSI
jgi:hypothetical protein